MENSNDRLSELYVFECDKLLHQLEEALFTANDNEHFEHENRDEIFRLVHTLKGTATMMNMSNLSHMAHILENVMVIAKNTSASLSDSLQQNLIDCAFDYAEYFRMAINALNSREAIKDNSVLKKKLETCHKLIVQHAEEHPIQDDEFAPVEVHISRENCYCLEIYLKHCSMAHMRAYVIVQSIRELCQAIDSEPQNLQAASERAQDIADNGFLVYFNLKKGISLNDIDQIITRQLFFDHYRLVHEPKQLLEVKQEEHQLLAATATSKVLNVQYDKVVDLINLIGELATAQTMLEGYLQQQLSADEVMAGLVAQIKRYTRDIQWSAMKISMIEIRSIFFQMRHLVRNMAADTKKQVNIITEGYGVAIDKSISELISDMLVHLVRNAFDHGIESADQREAKGKRPIGTIRLEAVRRNETIYIFVEDDGQGIDQEKILDKAENLGWLEKDRLDYKEHEIYDFIFKSGFSTNREVTQYSGRGVGLDIVMRKIEELGGQLSVKSAVNQGTSFCIAIPITLSVIEGLEIGYGERTMIIPLNILAHINQMPAADIVLEEDGSAIYQGRHYLPLNLEKQQYSPSYILFLKEYIGYYFLPVTFIGDVENYFIKPFPNYFAQALSDRAVFSGCVINKDGAIRCVLDVYKLILSNEHNQTLLKKPKD